MGSSVESMIDNIVTVVFRIHFYYVQDKDLEQDLKQEGYLKAYELLSLGNYDPTKNLRTFIYTGVRNAMSNYMYHHRKESHSNLETITSSLWQNYESITSDDFWKGKLFYKDEDSFDDIKISSDEIKKICDKYTYYGDYYNAVISKLNYLGLLNNNDILSCVPELQNDIITKAIVTSILWNYLDRSVT